LQKAASASLLQSQRASAAQLRPGTSTNMQRRALYAAASDRATKDTAATKFASRSSNEQSCTCTCAVVCFKMLRGRACWWLYARAAQWLHLHSSRLPENERARARARSAQARASLRVSSQGELFLCYIDKLSLVHDKQLNKLTEVVTASTSVHTQRAGSSVTFVSSRHRLAFLVMLAYSSWWECVNGSALRSKTH
jgi:hypothetical protein